MKLCTAVQEGCGYKDTLRAHRYFAPPAKYFTVCITYQPPIVYYCVCRSKITDWHIKQTKHRRREHFTFKVILLIIQKFSNKQYFQIKSAPCKIGDWLAVYLILGITISGRSQWPRWLQGGSAVARFLELWVRIPPGAWMSLSCERCVLSSRGLCVGLITRPKESYQVWRVRVRSWSLDDD